MNYKRASIYVHKTKEGKWFWRLVNYCTVLHQSKHYASERSCRDNINTVCACLAYAPVEYTVSAKK